MNNKTIGSALQQYESKIWESCDILYANGIKLSEAPRMMMPFFALMLVESRLRRVRDEKIAELWDNGKGVAYDPKDTSHTEWISESVLNSGFGYHKELVAYGTGLKDLCATNVGNFYTRLLNYLHGFDTQTKELLGVQNTGKKFLNIEGVSNELYSTPNNPLYPYAQIWAQVDMQHLTNSDVTTMEEHIKRKWADMSADTAGQQYTPSDIIDLAGQIVVALRKRNPKTKDICSIYDTTCGGGNFLFGTEDLLKSEFPHLSVQTRGQELNDALYALSAIEARFRPDARIEYGNTLTDDKFIGYKFNVIVANPPYGTPWDKFKTQIQADKTGRFHEDRMPPVSDSQLLFLQHCAFHLDPEDGVGTIVHSGSSLFSGDAGGGESETRRWLIQHQDMVEAIIQLPKNEFFNTGITTYIWVLNKNKPEHTKGKIAFINAETCFVKLRKNLNMKNCEIDEANRMKIVQTLVDFKDSDICKVLSIDDVLYNKVDLKITRLSESGKSVPMVNVKFNDIQSIEVDSKPLWAHPTIIPFADAATFKASIQDAETLRVITASGEQYRFEAESHMVWKKESDGTEMELGLGEFKFTYKKIVFKGGEENPELLTFSLAIGPWIEKDTEVISYASVQSVNEKNIQDFLTKWVLEPHAIEAITTGCEINFNKFFPKEIYLKESIDIHKEIYVGSQKIVALENEISRLIKVNKS